MNKVRVLLLSGCSRCHELISKLNSYNISYEAIDADENDKLAYAIEKATGTTAYPMIIIEQSLSNIYLFIANDVSQLEPRSINRNDVKIGSISVGVMADTLNLIINKKQ